MIVGGRLCIVVGISSAQEVEIAINQVGIEGHEFMVELATTIVELSIIGIAQLFAILVGLFQTTLAFEQVEQIVGRCPVLRVGFPTGVRVVYRKNDERHLTIVLHELHIGPSTHQLYLCQLTAHVVVVVLRSHGVGFGKVEVTLVDDLVVSRSV